MEYKRLEHEINLLHQRICYALGDPKRIMILYLLAEQMRCVNEIKELMGIPQSTVSRHLRVLRERKLVLTERRGTTILYKLADPQIIEALNTLRRVLGKQLRENINIANFMDIQ